MHRVKRCSRFHGNKKWVALVTSELNMSYIKAIETFGVLFENIQDQYTKLLTMDKLLLLFEYLLRSIGEHLGGIQNITVKELLNSPEYLMFKEMLEKSLSLNADFANHRLSLDNKTDMTDELKMAP